MESPSNWQSPLLLFTQALKGSSYIAISVLLLAVCVVTRAITGYLYSKAESQDDSSPKDPPILPYWLPFIGHALSFAWSFDTLLSKARSAFLSLFPLGLLPSLRAHTHPRTIH